MSRETPSLFGKTRFIESQIDEFLDKISEGGIYFELGIISYIDRDEYTEACAQKLQQLIDTKHRSRKLRRAISTELYTEMLIPDARSDVLSLLQSLYNLIDLCEDNFQDLAMSNDKAGANAQPKFPQSTKQNFKELTMMVVAAMETTITAARTYFRNPIAVRDFLHKVSVYETEADAIGLRLKKEIFRSELSLEAKIILRDSINFIDEIADKAEDVCDSLSIYAIKRAL
jgi:uncharacterized protein